MVDLATIKVDLPHWPDDVVDQWLLKLANRGPDTGWPPPEYLDGHAWKYILGRRPLAWWKSVAWDLQEHDLEFEVLSRFTRKIVNGMIEGHVNGLPNFYALPDGKARFLSATRYLAKHGTFPRPPIVMRVQDGLWVIDGNHRVSAFCYCRIASDQILQKGGTAPLKRQQLWIGTHATGEVPLD